MGDVYIRYQSFSGHEEFEKELKRRNPEKIDIGAVYNHKPKMRESATGFQPLEKEYIFLNIYIYAEDAFESCD
jgi:DNA primase small subunit